MRMILQKTIFLLELTCRYLTWKKRIKRFRDEIELRKLITFSISLIISWKTCKSSFIFNSHCFIFNVRQTFKPDTISNGMLITGYVVEHYVTRIFSIQSFLYHHSWGWSKNIYIFTYRKDNCTLIIWADAWGKNVLQPNTFLSNDDVWSFPEHGTQTCKQCDKSVMKYKLLNAILLLLLTCFFSYFLWSYIQIIFGLTNLLCRNIRSIFVLWNYPNRIYIAAEL